MLPGMKDACVSMPALWRLSVCGDKMCAWKEMVAYGKFKQNGKSLQENLSTFAVVGGRARS